MSIFAIDIVENGAIEKIVSDLRATEKHTVTAAFRALNKTALWLRTQATREISNEVQVPQKLIRERLRVLKASRKQLKALVLARLFGIRPNKIGKMRQTATGAKVGKFEFEGAFVATMPSTGTASIYKRKRKARLPIREMTVPIQPVASQVIEDYLDHRIINRFEQLFRHEITFLMQRS